MYTFDRLIGHDFEEISVQQDIRTWPFQVINNNSTPNVKVINEEKERSFSAEEILSFIFAKMKSIAEVYTGENITRAVITVPAQFTSQQIESLKHAATLANLEIIETIDEPIAAAIAYRLDSKPYGTNIIVYDLGGGTCDVSLLTVGFDGFDYLARSSDVYLGGNHFDNRVVDYFIKRFNKKHTIDLSTNKTALAKMKLNVEKAKRVLSSGRRVRIEIDDIVQGIDFDEVLTREKFNKLNKDLFEKTIELLETVLKEAPAGMDISDISEIVLVGGSTRIPKIKQLVKEFFDGKEFNTGIIPEEVIAYGAAVYAATL